MTILIGGSPRTGTTLTQSMLCMDSNSPAMLPEPSHLMALLDVYREGKTTWNDAREYEFVSSGIYMMLHKTAVGHYLEQLQNLAGGGRLILKHPLMTVYFPDITELFPGEFDFIITVRDPLDTIASFKRDSMKKGDQPYDKEYYLLSYLQSYKALPNIQDGQVSFIQYEQLVLNPEAGMAKLREASGLPLNFDPRGTELPTHSMYNDENRAQQPQINQANVGKYDDVLTQEEIDYVLDNSKEIIDILGLDPFHNVSAR